VLMGRETGTLQLLAPLLLTGGKGADLVIRGDVVLNTLSARSTSTLLRDQICINSSSSWQVFWPSQTVLRGRLRFRSLMKKCGMKSLMDDLLLLTVNKNRRENTTGNAARRKQHPTVVLMVACRVHRPAGVVSLRTAGHQPVRPRAYDCGLGQRLPCRA
jgi:hypothetical protein